MRRQAALSLAVALSLSISNILLSQQVGPFPDPIPMSGVSVEVKTVATIPDSSANNPARLSVLTQDPSGRLFVNDQRGPLYHFDEATGAVSEYLDIRDYGALQIVSTSEAGFQSFAFHPDFHDSSKPGYGRFYTSHSSGNTGSAPDFNPGGNSSFHTLLLEWRTLSPEADAFVPADAGNPYRELMRLKQPFGNHNTGLIAFNPTVREGDADYGNLYVAVGDGGSGGDPQENGEDPSNPFGAILRINPLGSDSANGAYGIVAENSLASDNDNGTLSEIYCYGLRNPQRFGWDLVTRNMFIADIGQNEVEEINLAANGAHFGWDIREGSFPFEGSNTAGLTDPVAEYDHFNTVSDPPTGIGNRAITVGEVVRGTSVDALEGMLLLSDFPTGLIFILNVDTDPLDGGQGGLSELTLHTGDNSPVRLLDLINAARNDRGLSDSSRADLRFSVNTPGRIYIINKRDGLVRRIVPTGQPESSVSLNESGNLLLHFEGLLQSSSDLEEWDTVVPQPLSPVEINPQQEPDFLRVIRP